MTVGRNDRCPCGSGRKYKSCCINNTSRGMSRGLIALLAGIGVIAAVGVVPSLIGEKSSTTSLTPASAPASSRTAPPGKVWSAEHGHWHDASPASATGRSAPATPQVEVFQQKGGTLQPGGTPPPGKVWSTEHNHWHDAQPR